MADKIDPFDLELSFNEISEESFEILSKEVYYPFMADWGMLDFLSFSAFTYLKLLDKIYHKKPKDIVSESNLKSYQALLRMVSHAEGKIQTLLNLIDYAYNKGFDPSHFFLPSEVSIKTKDYAYIEWQVNKKELENQTFKLKYKKFYYYVILKYVAPDESIIPVQSKIADEALVNCSHIYALVRKSLQKVDKTKFKKNELYKQLAFNNYQNLYYFENKLTGTLETMLKLTDFYFREGINPVTFSRAIIENPCQPVLPIYIYDHDLFKSFEQRRFEINHLGEIYNIQLVLIPLN